MAEIVCSNCGCVFFGAADTSICPHCGQNPQKTPWKKLSILASDNFGMILWLVWLGRRFRRPGLSGLNWDDYVFFAVLLICAGAYSVYLEYTRRRGKGTVVTLDLSAQRASTAASENSWTPPPRPSVPAQWLPLMSLPRPREVYWPIWSKVWTAVEVAFILGSVGFFAYVVHGSMATFRRWAAVWKDDLPLFIVTLAADFIVFGGIYGEFQNRQLLRDGEATIGTIVDWIAGRRNNSTAVYQFWTRSGRRFEHRGPVRSNKDEYSAPGSVPVFYLPEDPTSSLALCCTALRVRIPGEDMAVRMQRIATKL